MSRQLGRISGPLLSSNLLRDGINLAFETNLLYIDVVHGRIGIKSDAPPTELFVNNTINTTNLIVDTQFTVPNFSFSSNNIQKLTGSLYLRPNQATNPEITAPAIATSLLNFNDNVLLNATDGSHIELSPIGTGVANIRADVNVYGGVHATGNITWDGDITLGNNDEDNIYFSADVKSDIVPNNPLNPLTTELSDLLTTQTGDGLLQDVLETYTLGSSSKMWKELHANVVNTRFNYSALASIGTAYLGNYRITSNTITNNVSNQPMYLQPNGSGQVKFNDNNYVYDSSIFNRTDGALTIGNTNQGYTKFTGTYGIVIPSGPTVSAEGAVLGQIRFNTELGFVRVFNGTEWISSIGASSSISVEETTDIMDVWTLILG